MRWRSHGDWLGMGVGELMGRGLCVRRGSRNRIHVVKSRLFRNSVQHPKNRIENLGFVLWFRND